MLRRKLPSELEEEILTRLPPLSLVRFRAVCKQWNALFYDKIFASNHFACTQARPEFFLQTDSKMYSVSVNLNDDDPNMKVRELPFDIIGLESRLYLDMVGCYGYVLLCDIRDTLAVWNPWLRQSRLVESEHKPLWICGIGYVGSSPQRSYKIVGYTIHNHIRRIVIYEFATNAWKFIDPPLTENFLKEGASHHNSVSLNGNLYWTAYDLQNGQCLIGILDCSKEILKPFCMLPCKKKDASHKHVFAVFKGDRFSLLEKCERTRKMEIWVTQKKITNGDNGEDVVWIKFMSVSIPNVAVLYHFSSYLVDDNIYGKSLVMCCRDETRQACVYIVRGDMCTKIKTDEVVGELRCCTVYVPSLIPIP